MYGVFHSDDYQFDWNLSNIFRKSDKPLTIWYEKNQRIFSIEANNLKRYSNKLDNKYHLISYIEWKKRTFVGLYWYHRIFVHNSVRELFHRDYINIRLWTNGQRVEIMILHWFIHSDIKVIWNHMQTPLLTHYSLSMLKLVKQEQPSACGVVVSYPNFIEPEKKKTLNFGENEGKAVILNNGDGFSSNENSFLLHQCFPSLSFDAISEITTTTTTKATTKRVLSLSSYIGESKLRKFLLFSCSLFLCLNIHLRFSSTQTKNQINH